MKLIAETEEHDKASGHAVKVKWYVSEVAHEQLPEAVRKAVTGETGNDTVTG
mgnify:FL=1